MSEDETPTGRRTRIGTDIRSWNEAPTIQDLRERVEQITGIDLEGSKPRDLTWKDWKNLVHYLETEVETAEGDTTE